MQSYLYGSWHCQKKCNLRPKQKTTISEMVSFSKVYVNCQNFVVKIILQLNVVSYDRYENCDFFMCLFVFQTLQSDKYQAKKKESMADDLTIFQQNQIRNWYIGTLVHWSAPMFVLWSYSYNLQIRKIRKHKRN